MICLLSLLIPYSQSIVTVSLAGTVLTVKGTGIIDKTILNSQGDPSKFTEIIIESGPDTLDHRSFANMRRLEHIHFSDTITSILGSPFYENLGLVRFTIDENNKKFCISSDNQMLMDYEKTVLYKVVSNPGSVTIPSTITTIKQGCFGRTTMTDLIVPASVQVLETQSFTDCKMDYIHFEPNSKITEIVKWTFYYATANLELHIPASVTIIKDLAFQTVTVKKIIFDETSQLTTLESSALANMRYSGGSIKLPPSITEIPPLCFESSTITELNIPKDCTKIDTTAFQGCSSLAVVTVDSGNQYYKMVGETLYNKDETELIFVMPSATSLTISQSLENISNTLVQGLVNIDSITVDNNPRYEGYKGCLYNKTCEVLIGVCGGVKILEVHQSTKVIDKFAAKSVNLNKVIFPPNLLEIGSNAFRDCKMLISVTFPSSLQQISDSAFQDATGLTEFCFEPNPQLHIIGMGAFMNCQSLKKAVIPNTVATASNSFLNGLIALETLEFPLDLKLTYISNYAFNMTGLSSNPPTLVIPRKITSIYSNAFYRANLKFDFSQTNIQTIGDYGFETCYFLRGIVTLPSTLVSIGQSAFASCTNIEEIRFQGDSLKTIAAGAMSGCKKLAKINLLASLQSFDPACFSGCFNLVTVEGPAPNSGSAISVSNNIVYNTDCSVLIACPPGLLNAIVVGDTKIIGENAFYKCEILKNVIFNNPSKVCEISKNTFSGCISLEHINLPASVYFVGDMSFMGCTALIAVDFSFDTCIGQIGSSAFEGCVKLNIVKIYDGKNFTKIGSSAFAGCESLTSFALTSKIESVGSKAFKGCGLTEIVLKAATYGTEAFSNCTKLVMADVSHIDSIPDSLFADCVKLSKVIMTVTKTVRTKRISQNITNITQTRIMNVRSIGVSAFSNTGIVSITIPSGVESLGESAFAGCPNLDSVNISGTVSQIGTNCFGGCPMLRSIIYCGIDSVANSCGFGSSVGVYVRENFSDKAFCGVDARAVLDMWCGFEVPTFMFTDANKKGAGLILLMASILADGVDSNEY